MPRVKAEKKRDSCELRTPRGPCGSPTWQGSSSKLVSAANLSRRVARSALVELPVDGAGRNSEQLSGIRFVPTRVPERLADHAALELLERRADRKCQRRGSRGGCLRDGLRKVLETNRLGSAQHSRPLHDVLELAH